MQKTLYSREYRILLTILKDMRKTTGVTQGALAERLGMRQSDVSKCEAGSRRLDVIELKFWTAALGFGVNDVLAELDGRLAADVVWTQPASPRGPTRSRRVRSNSSAR
ncbi:helix-turn-helix transcriptional regulator [Piscinibacter sp. XHJ-5]|uniref:helix-turn-helix domain-containing protein n=1 Tax=Piscinibacter sp. XHJ-5 TaxID=3037797 RepID=UPI002452B9A7|nr:helix-turn-helix transcriptional regulator [Piscinibacter sp. XHJ-5]